MFFIDTLTIPNHPSKQLTLKNKKALKEVKL